MQWKAAVLTPLILLFVPMAHAQQVPPEPDVRVNTPAEAVLTMPETEDAVIPFTVEVRCTPVDYSALTTHVAVGVEATPAYAQVVVTPPTSSYTDDPAECLNAATESVRVIPFEVRVVVDRQAPAFEDVNVNLNLTLERGDYLFGPYNATVQVTPDYLAGIQAVPVHSTIRLAANQQGKIPVEVTNLANGDTRINSEIRPTSSRELAAVIAPPPFILESNAAHGAAAHEAKTVYVIVRTPAGVGTGNDYTFELVLTGEFALKGGTETDTVVVELGVTKDAPGDPAEAYDAVVPGPGFALSAVALFLGLGLRLRRPRLS